MFKQLFLGSFASTLINEKLGITIEGMNSVSEVADSVAKDYLDLLTAYPEAFGDASHGFSRLAKRAAESARQRGAEQVDSEDVETGKRQCGIIFLCIPPDKNYSIVEI